MDQTGEESIGDRVWVDLPNHCSGSADRFIMVNRPLTGAEHHPCADGRAHIVNCGQWDVPRPAASPARSCPKAPSQSP